MFAVVEVPQALVRRTASQRRHTLGAIVAGEPNRAAPIRQVRDRRAYIRHRWPEFAEYDREGLVGSDNTLWSSFLSRGARCALAVGRISQAESPAESRALGTGFMVADAVLLTNHHVLCDEATAGRAVVEFGYEYDESGRERKPQAWELDPTRLFMTGGEDLDYTLVALRPNRRQVYPGASQGYLPLIGVTGKASNGEPLNVIHHPAGGRKKITIRESRLLAIEDRTLAYSGDTLGGSSGSPVFNDQWEVVGLHFAGQPKRDEHRRPLTTAGDVWTEDMPDSAKAYEFNVALRISQILKDLKRRRPRNEETKVLQRAVLAEAGST